MSIKAHIDRDANGNIIVQMKGDLNYENSSKLRSELKEIVDANPTSDVTLNMQSIDFVGSSGIGQFVQTITAINNKKTRVRLSNVRSEFIKVFKLYKLTEEDLAFIIEDFDNDETADLAQRFGKKFTFQN